MVFDSNSPIVDIIAGNAFDLSIESAMFEGMDADIELRPVDVWTTGDLAESVTDVMQLSTDR